MAVVVLITTPNHVLRSCCTLVPHTSGHVQESDASLICSSYMPKTTSARATEVAKSLDMRMHSIIQYERNLVKVHEFCLTHGRMCKATPNPQLHMIAPSRRHHCAQSNASSLQHATLAISLP